MSILIEMDYKIMLRLVLEIRLLKYSDDGNLSTRGMSPVGIGYNPNDRAAKES